jgi:malic enzyme
VFHDDQHGTAVVVLAALENALRLVDKQMADLRVAILGVGASGTAIAKIMHERRRRRHRRRGPAGDPARRPRTG